MFKLSYKVPANTSPQVATHKKLSIAKGRIIGWIVFTPEESADLLKLNIQYHGLQLFPFTGSEWWYGNTNAFLIPEDFSVLDSPYVLDIYAFNLDDTFDHEYIVCAVIDPVKEPVGVTTETVNWFGKLRDLFGGT